jgi:hypothetical protein
MQVVLLLVVLLLLLLQRFDCFKVNTLYRSNHLELSSYIDNHEEDIGNTSKKYFGLGKDKPDILSRGFYKLWEILMIYDLIV